MTETAAASRRARLLAALAAPVDIAWLAAFRILFGLTAAVSMVRFLAYGWIDDFWVTPTFHFKYWGFEWVEPLSRAGMYALFQALAVLALCIAAGFCFRLAAVLFFLGFTYLQLIDVTTYLNHYYLSSLLSLLLLVSPAHRAWSVDAWLRPALARTTVPAAWHYLLRFQVAVVYTFAGIAKLHGDWLLHGQPLRIWLASRTGLPLLGWLFEHDGVALAMSWGGFLFDTGIASLMLIPRVRPFAYVVIIGFHAVTRMLFPIGMFPVIMVLSALVFFSPSWPRRWLPRRFALPVVAAQVPALPLRRAAIALGAAWCLVQVAMPVRFLLYGGNVRWHEQGMRFSWRVMVREKNGSVTFLARNTVTGKVWHVPPSRYLNALQEREMSGQPDLILQMAHHIHDDFARRGLGPVEVRADAIASLNGRPAARLIDPDVDLASVQDGLARADWILPAPDSDPPHVRPVRSASR